MSFHPLNFYSNEKRRYLHANEKPTLKRGKKFETIDELWEEYDEILLSFDKTIYNKYDSELLEIVNYDYIDSDNEYLLFTDEAEYFASDEFINRCNSGYYMDEEKLDEDIGFDFYNDPIAIIIFIKVYYTELIYNLYNEEVGGGPSKLRETDTDLYMENIEQAYLNLIKIKNFDNMPNCIKED